MTKEEFFSNTMPEPNTGCWIWCRYIGKKGYGEAWDNVNKTTKLAHRYSYEIHKGQIDKELYVCHTCDNKFCVNPDHLFLGTHQDNMDDMVVKKRSMIGGRNNKAVLTECQIVEIRARFNLGMTRRQLRVVYNIGNTTIKDIIARKTWKHLQ